MPGRGGNYQKKNKIKSFKKKVEGENGEGGGKPQ